MKKITRKEAMDMIENTKGKVFTVKFTKSSGEEREMNCRTGVESFRHGGENSTAHKPHIITVFEMPKLQYRKFNINNLKEFKFAGTMYTVED